MRYLFMVAAAVILTGILVGQGLSMRESAPTTPVAAVNALAATSVSPSWTASAPSETAEARVKDEAGQGGDGGLAVPGSGTPSVTVAPASTELAGEAQEDEHPPVEREAAGSSPVTSATPETVVASALAGVTNEAESDISLEEQVRAAVEELFPASEWETAMRVSGCESGFNPMAVEPGRKHFGVMQVAPEYWGPVPADIPGQVEQAYHVWLVSGWGAWSCH